MTLGSLQLKHPPFLDPPSLRPRESMGFVAVSTEVSLPSIPGLLPLAREVCPSVRLSRLSTLGRMTGEDVLIVDEERGRAAAGHQQSCESKCDVRYSVLWVLINCQRRTVEG